VVSNPVSQERKKRRGKREGFEPKQATKRTFAWTYVAQGKKFSEGLWKKYFYYPLKSRNNKREKNVVVPKGGNFFFNYTITKGEKSMRSDTPRPEGGGGGGGDMAQWLGTGMRSKESGKRNTVSRWSPGKWDMGVIPPRWFSSKPLSQDLGRAQTRRI